MRLRVEKQDGGWGMGDGKLYNMICYDIQSAVRECLDTYLYIC